MVVIVAVAMVMAAVFVMLVIVRATMMVVVVMRMIMIVTLHRRRRVSATFRFERRINHDHFGAKRRQQNLDRRFTLGPNPIGQQLDLDMPVAEMPGQPGQRGNVGGPRLNQRFGRGDDLDQVAIVEHQKVVGAQSNWAMQIEVDGRAFGADHRPLRRATLRIVENDGVRRGPAMAVVGGDNAGGARHGNDGFGLGDDQFSRAGRSLSGPWLAAPGGTGASVDAVSASPLAAVAAKASLRW